MEFCYHWQMIITDLRGEMCLWVATKIVQHFWIVYLFAQCFDYHKEEIWLMNEWIISLIDGIPHIDVAQAACIDTITINGIILWEKYLCCWAMKIVNPLVHKQFCVSFRYFSSGLVLPDAWLHCFDWSFAITTSSFTMTLECSGTADDSEANISWVQY